MTCAYSAQSLIQSYRTGPGTEKPKILRSEELLVVNGYIK